MREPFPELPSPRSGPSTAGPAQKHWAFVPARADTRIVEEPCRPVGMSRTTLGPHNYGPEQP
jgi:hypothetical protein